MRLETYLKDKGISHADFGKLVDASEFGVRKWARGERTPRPEAMRRIEEVTGGEVKPNDFIDLPQDAAA